MKRNGAWVVLVSLAFGAAAFAADLPKVELYKSPECGCCGKWAEHLKQQGFDVTTHSVYNVSPERKRLGVPDTVSSCHTAVVGGYVIEGHVPAADIKRLLAEKPKALGLAAPGMPKGSPGMESSISVPYDVVLVQADGSARAFAHH